MQELFNGFILVIALFIFFGLYKLLLLAFEATEDAKIGRYDSVDKGE